MDDFEIQIGLVSRGYEDNYHHWANICMPKGFPTIFVNVAYFKEWILSFCPFANFVEQTNFSNRVSEDHCADMPCIGDDARCKNFKATRVCDCPQGKTYISELGCMNSCAEIISVTLDAFFLLIS